MKKKEIAFYSLFFLASSLLAINLVFMAYINRGILSLPSLFQKNNDYKLSSVSTCSDKPKRIGMENSTDKRLQRLADYEVICDSRFADKTMVFTNMPKDDSEARENAKKMAQIIKEFEKHNVKPLVIVEPETSWGLVDFSEFNTGFYDSWIATYFKELKARGVNNQNIGYWVPFPEANLPYWNRKNASPSDFSNIVNRYLKLAKAEFSGLHGSVLLNSATYESDDFDWERGDYTSLVPYVAGLDKTLVSSFGLQGFPWAPAANRSGNGIFDAQEFLNADLAIEAATKIGVNEVWFNTGTFAAKYTQDENRRIEISPEKRKDVTKGEITQVKKAKNKGFKVWINIFAEDKSKVAESTNWSYILTSDKTKSHQAIFTDFISNLVAEKIPISMYDIR